MNLVKLEDDLKQLPEQTLIGYVQYPQNHVPTYLVLAELERRKRMKQGAMASMQQQNTTVADRMVAEAQPQHAHQAGVASLPVENIGDEAAYAAGGIVAFEDGGAVQRYQNKGFVQLSPEQFARLSPQAQAQYLAQQAAENRAAMRGLGLFTLPRTTPVQPTTPQISRTLPPLTEIEMAQYNLPKTVGARPPMYQNVSSEALQKTPRERTARDGTTITQEPQKRPPSGPDADRVPNPPATQGGIGALYTAPADLSGEFVIPEATTAEAARKRYLEMVGDDPFQQRAEEKLAAMEARAKEDERVAPWLALAEAGFAIAGGESPYAATNIGKGAQKGIESLAKAKERAAAAEEKRFEIESRLAQARRAEQIAATTQGFESEAASQARQDTQRLAKLNYKAQREADIANNQFNDRKFALEYKQREREIKIMADKADKQIAATANAMEKELLRARLSSLTTQLEEKNKQIKDALAAGEDVTQLRRDYAALESALATIGTKGTIEIGPDGKQRYVPNK